MKIEKWNIKLQEHIVKTILDFPVKIEATKKLQVFLGILNYARMYVNDLSKLVWPLYSKSKLGSKKFFNSSNIELVIKKKNICKELLELTLPLEIRETDFSVVFKLDRDGTTILVQWGPSCRNYKLK